MNYDNYGLDSFKPLVGRLLRGLAVSAGEGYLRFSVADDTEADNPDQDIFVEVDGGCCSESWWADVLGAKSCYGGTITGVRELDLPDYDVEDGRCRQKVDSVYGYALDTTKGTITLAFRNSSNGYYGGTCSLYLKEPDVRFRKIATDNWSA